MGSTVVAVESTERVDHLSVIPESAGALIRDPGPNIRLRAEGLWVSAMGPDSPLRGVRDDVPLHKGRACHGLTVASISRSQGEGGELHGRCLGERVDHPPVIPEGAGALIRDPRSSHKVPHGVVGQDQP